MTVIHKVTVAKAAGGDALEFVLSDETKDRYGDIIKVDGWVLTNFKKNPIALFNHSSNFPIGFWSKVRAEAGKLIGTLNLAARGTSDRIDEIISLVEQGVLRAVSVGFQPIERDIIRDEDGFIDGFVFTKQELLETSLVSVPANPSAVQLARSLKISDDTIAFVFGKHAERDGAMRRGATGEHAAKPQNRKSGTMKPISERIKDTQTRLVALKDQRDEQLAAIDDNEPDQAALDAIEEVNKKIAGLDRLLGQLKCDEQDSAHQSEPVVHVRDSGTAHSGRKPFAAPAKKIEPREYVFRAAAVSLLSRIEQKDKNTVLRERYGEDEPTKIVLDALTRAASAPALTTTTGWAAELVQIVVADFIDVLMPESVYPGLAAIGGRFTFGRNGIVSLPARSTASTIAGSFVGQGAPIPVRQGAFTAATLTPKKMGVISTFTREIAEHSTPSIEQIIRQAIQEDTAVAVDSVLLDANAATSIRPAGLRNGITGGTPATVAGGNTFAAAVTDLKALIASLITATNGILRRPVWIMNPQQELSLSLQTATVGGAATFPFAAEIAQDRLLGYPLLSSNTCPAGTVIIIDAADYFSATGDEPRFDASDQAVLHMEDTTPLAIGTAGTPPTVAAPVRSLWQTDSIGIRMLLDINWTLRRTGVVAFVAAVNW